MSKKSTVAALALALAGLSAAPLALSADAPGTPEIMFSVSTNMYGAVILITKIYI